MAEEQTTRTAIREAGMMARTTTTTKTSAAAEFSLTSAVFSAQSTNAKTGSVTCTEEEIEVEEEQLLDSGDGDGRRSRNRKHKHKHNHEKPHRNLVTYHDLPQWQKDNDFIIYGYVSETKNIWHCLDTLFFYNNETLNIFSHLLPGTVFPLLMAIFIPYLVVHENFIASIPPWLVHLPAFTNTDESDYRIFALFFIGFMVCLSCSATFHMLKVHSHKIASMGSRLDYAGILLLIASSLIGIIHYSFIDQPALKNAFLTITSVIGVVSLLVTWHPDFRTPEWRPIRTSTFVIFAFSGLIPICYGFVVMDWRVAADRAGLKYVGYEALSYLTGAVIYAFRMPERLSPGTFDMIGNSHQIFHCLVVLGAYCHFRALVHAYMVAKSTTLGGQLL